MCLAMLARMRMPVVMPVRGRASMLMRVAMLAGVVMPVRGHLPQILRRRRAALAIHPPRVAILVVLLLPDGHTMFDLIDNVAAGAECFVPVSRASTNINSHVPDGEVADAMDARSVLDTKALDGFGNDAFAFLHRERLERLVLQVSDAQTFVVIAYETLERGVAPARRIGELGAHGGYIDGSATKAKRSH